MAYILYISLLASDTRLYAAESWSDRSGRVESEEVLDSGRGGMQCLFRPVCSTPRNKMGPGLDLVKCVMSDLS